MTNINAAFDDYSSILLGLRAVNSAAELHGLVTGRLAGGKRYTQGAWLKEAMEFLDIRVNPAESDLKALHQLYDATLNVLQEDQFSFHPMLPDDDTEFAVRLQSLAQWCHGFLSGLGSSGLEGSRELSTEATEAMRDLAAIVQLNDQQSEGEEAEKDYVTIVEYVRVAVVTLFTECNTNGTISDPTVH